MKIVDTIGLPAPVLEAIKNKPYDAGGADRSITGLITPPRITQLIERLGDKVEQEAADLIYTIEGSAMHAVFEWASQPLRNEIDIFVDSYLDGEVSLDGLIKKVEEIKHKKSLVGPPSVIFERRMFAEIDGWKISGQVDLIDLSNRLIQDYKRCSYWTAVFGVKDEWTQQLNGYRWLCHKNGIDIDKLEIVAVFRDWSKEKAWYSNPKDYPQKGIQIFPIETWPIKQAEDWLRERVELHKKAAKMKIDALPLCTPFERWEKPLKFAVEVEGEKKARRLANTRSEALSWMAENVKPQDIPKAKIVQRNSEPKRCVGWCPVRFQCSFGKKVAR